MLAERGVVADRISAAQGRERSDSRFDIYRWEAHGKTLGFPDAQDGCSVMVSSYDTMTKCVRYGFVLDKGMTMLGGESWWQLSAYATGVRES